MMMSRGRVKWFNRQKGYGFIVADGDALEYFVHISDCPPDVYLNEGVMVDFEPGQGSRGLIARKIKVPIIRGSTDEQITKQHQITETP